MGKSTPAAPDYTGAANAQAAASKENLMTQNYANRPTINTPFGSQSWSTQTQIDPTTSQAVTGWTQENTVAPELQSALDAQISSQNQRSQLANSFMNRVGSEYASHLITRACPQ
jgi:uridine phosphorylase